MIKTILASLLRHALTAGGALLVSDGLATQSQSADLVGAGMVAGGIAWSWWQKYGQQKAAAALAKATAPRSGPAQAKQP